MCCAHQRAQPAGNRLAGARRGGQGFRCLQNYEIQSECGACARSRLGPGLAGDHFCGARPPLMSPLPLSCPCRPQIGACAAVAAITAIHLNNVSVSLGSDVSASMDQCVLGTTDTVTNTCLYAYIAAGVGAALALIMVLVAVSAGEVVQRADVAAPRIAQGSPSHTLSSALCMQDAGDMPCKLRRRKLPVHSRTARLRQRGACMRPCDISPSPPLPLTLSNTPFVTLLPVDSASPASAAAGATSLISSSASSALLGWQHSVCSSSS